MNLAEKVKKYREASGASCEQIAQAIGVDPVKFRCFLFGRGKLTKFQIMMLDVLISTKMANPNEEVAAVK